MGKGKSISSLRGVWLALSFNYVGYARCLCERKAGQDKGSRFYCIFLSCPEPRQSLLITNRHMEQPLKLMLMILLTVAVNILPATSQKRSENMRPRWINNLPKPSNNTFTYETVTAEGTTLDEARQKCLNELISTTGFKNGVVTVTNNNSTEDSRQIWHDGKYSEDYDMSSSTTISMKGAETKLFVKNVAEYWQRDKSGEYTMTKLFAKSESDTHTFDNTAVTDRYGARGLWRSAIIPGWGQIYKGSVVKGSLILGGTAVLIGGIIFTENERAHYAGKIKGTHNEQLRKSYRNKRNNFATARNVCIGATAALYVYNLVDAVVSRGASRVVVKNYGSRGGAYSVAPSVATDGSLAVTASLTF